MINKITNELVVGNESDTNNLHNVLSLKMIIALDCLKAFVV